MAVELTLQDVRRAWDHRDPELPRLIRELAAQPVPARTQQLQRDDVSYQTFLNLRYDIRFLQKSREERRQTRVALLAALEAPDAKFPLPDVWKLHTIILEIWQSDEPFARSCLFEIIAETPLTYGPWRAFKRIFKESESRDPDIYFALAARFDSTQLSTIPRGTLAYLARRAWRTLRRTAKQLPALYADHAVCALERYPESVNWRATWLANHIFFHATKKYGRVRWRWLYNDRHSPKQLKDRAYPELWKRGARPLFSLLERARNDDVREFAAAALKSDYRAILREMEPVWVARLVGVGSRAIDEFVIWLLQNVPTFDQAGFRANGIHEAVLQLFDSPSDAARKYAADYGRIHARDLTIAEWIRLASNSHEAVRKLAQDRLGEKDPRTEVGLPAWGTLLETEHGFAHAASVLKQYFSAKELTPDWFADRLLSGHSRASEFARELLPKVHDSKKLGVDFFLKLVQRAKPDEAASTIAFACAELEKLDLNSSPSDLLQRLVLKPGCWRFVSLWVREGKLKPQTAGVPFWKALAFHPDWESDATIAAIRDAEETLLSFDENRASEVLNWLGDARKFDVTEIGFSWLMRLVARSEPLYHDFAVDFLIRAFAPSDFVVNGASEEAVASGPADLKQATFLFTGKLATMTRDEAENKVTAAQGKVAGSVTAKLHYLVIGDEGSPLYGQGKKGSKQVKAEQLNGAGANIRIISETLFLQMLAGRKRDDSTNQVMAGCEELWKMVVAPGAADAPVGKFARLYIRKHHMTLGVKLTDKPVDPGTEIPQEFLTLDRFFPLFSESRRPLRDFAVEIATYEFARWNPAVDRLIALSESPFADVRRFLAKALLADDLPENRSFRLDPSRLEPAAVYQFCESADEEARALGMELIRRLPQLRVPEELFRLTESPDRRVRAFVIRSLWQSYRERGVTEAWKPPVAKVPALGAKGIKEVEKRNAERGDGVPERPVTWPAQKPSLAAFLRRVLFEIPPGPPEKSPASEDDDAAQNSQKGMKVKPIAARRAKLDAVETMRDMACRDREFAAGILPLLREFLLSRGVSERAACLVAVTRIETLHPELKPGHDA